LLASFNGPAFAVPDTLPSTVLQAIGAPPSTAALRNAGEPPPQAALAPESVEIFNGDFPVTKEMISAVDLGMLTYFRAYPPRSKAAYQQIRPVLKQLLKPYLAYATTQILAQMNEAMRDHAARITTIYIRGITPVNPERRQGKRSLLTGRTIAYMLKRELVKLGMDKHTIKTPRGDVDSDWRLNVRMHADMAAYDCNAAATQRLKPRAPMLSRYV